MENLSGYMTTQNFRLQTEKHFNKVDSSLSEWRNGTKEEYLSNYFKLHILIAKVAVYYTLMFIIIFMFVIIYLI